MFKLAFITSILHLPERSLRLIKDNTFIKQNTRQTGECFVL